MPLSRRERATLTIVVAAIITGSSLCADPRVCRAQTSSWGDGATTRLMGTATDASKALLVNGALVWALNAGIRYGRGDDDGPAFPSGSTSAAFAIAPILRGRFGWKAGVPALALASFAAAEEVDEGARSTPEVFGGAALGLIVGGFMAHRESGDKLPTHLCVDKCGVGVEFKF